MDKSIYPNVNDITLSQKRVVKLIDAKSYITEIMRLGAQNKKGYVEVCKQIDNLVIDELKVQSDLTQN